MGLRQCLALGPLAIYLLVLGIINLSRRPVVVSGGRDRLALGIAVSGMIAVGPVELFLPIDVAIFFGGYVWLLLGALYGLTILLLALVRRPRLSVYNISEAELQRVLGELVVLLDPGSQWTGEILILPRLGVQLMVDSVRSLRNVSLIAIGDRQSYEGWAQLEAALAKELAAVRVPPNPRGLTLALIGSILLGAITWSLARDPLRISEEVSEMLFR
jgi:hypothetical protein